jgi:hypothetical protein
MRRHSLWTRSGALGRLLASARSPAKSERVVCGTWIEDPPHAGRYYIEMVVLDARGDVLAHESSSEFHVD